MIDTLEPHDSASGKPWAFAIDTVNVGSQLDMAHQPTVVTIDSRSRSSVRFLASCSLNNCASVKGRWLDTAAGPAEGSPLVAFQRFSRTARCHCSDSFTPRRM